jgi:SOS-response transcriptional repressor LexA
MIASVAKWNGERLARARRADPRKLTQEGLGSLVQISRGMIARYESNRDIPPEPTIRRLSEALNIPEAFFDEESARTNADIPVKSVTLINAHAEPDYLEIPYWGEVPAGDWTMPQGDEAMQMQVERALAKPGRISVRIAGDSMSPRLQHGDVVHIQLSKTPREGCLTLARNGSNELTLKQLKHKEGSWELQSLNPEYSNPTATSWEILGFAVVVERHFGPGRYTREVDEVGIRV